MAHMITEIDFRLFRSGFGNFVKYLRYISIEIFYNTHFGFREIIRKSLFFDNLNRLALDEIYIRGVVKL